MLNNLGVLVTRPLAQAQTFAEKVRAEKGRAYIFPMIEIIPADDLGWKTWEGLSTVDVVTFTSKNAVEHAIFWLKRCLPAHCSLAAMGAGTAEALKQHGFHPDIIPQSPYNSEALLAHPEFTHPEHQTHCVITGKWGRTLLQDTLAKRGAHVLTIEVYERKPAPVDLHALEELFKKRLINVVTLTSQEILMHFLETVDALGKTYFSTVRVIVITSTMERMAREENCFADVILANDASDETLLAVLRTMA